MAEERTQRRLAAILNTRARLGYVPDEGIDPKSDSEG